MPNTGKPSRGCYRCRQRRVKCDLSEPQCQKCLRLGQPCPGYRKELDLLFQNESQESFPESTSRDRRKTNLSHSNSSSNHGASVAAPRANLDDMTAHVTLFDKLIYRNESLPWDRSESWDQHAIPLVISLFSSPTAHGERFYGFMDFFPEMVAKASEKSPLVLCCKAVAFMYFDNMYEIATEGSKRSIAAYGEALNATNAALSDQDLCLRDEILVSIWLLSVYENLRGPNMTLKCPGRPPTWNMHILGLTSLVRTMSGSQSLEGSGQRFFWMVISLVESRSLAAGVECPREILDWLEEHIQDFIPEELDVHHNLVHGYHASISCAKIRRIIDNEHFCEPQSMLEVIEEARRLGRETEANVAQDARTKHLRLRRAQMHNFHRAVRVHIQYSVLELLRSQAARNDPELFPQFLDKQQSLSISAVQDLARDILETVPLILGSEKTAQMVKCHYEDELERPRCWVDAMRLMWPLRVLGSRRVISKEQREVIERTLQRLNDELHIRAAVVPYAIPQQMQLGRLSQAKMPKWSKGCKTCRRRKVKCDEARPLCQRCHASRLDCEGYESRFVNFDPAQTIDLDRGIIERLDELTVT